MQEMQEMHIGTDLLTARQVQRMLEVDKSTIYRMASDGRLPGIKIGKQWRFPAKEIERLLGRHGSTVSAPRIDPDAAQAVIEVMAEELGVMMVVTDATGIPLTQVVNPCPIFAERMHDQEAIAECVAEWKSLADDVDLTPRLRGGSLGFECARAFVRSGTTLVGMVLAGGIAPVGIGDQRGLHRLDAVQRRRVLDALPTVAALVGRCAVETSGALKVHDMRRTI